MKKLLFLGLGSALMFTMGGVGPAQADAGPHISGAAATSGGLAYVSDAAGKCAACHRAHTAQASFLLKQSQPALCYTCHDGTGVATTDVKDGQLPGPGGAALRGGGFVNAAIDSGKANSTWVAGSRTAPTIPTLGTGVPVTSRHEVDGVTSGTAWGNGANGTSLGATITLECGSCHDPHGNGNYRILRPVPNDSGAVKAALAVTAVTGVPDNPATPLVNEFVKAVAASPAVTAVVIPPVVIPDATAKGYTTTNYWLTGDSTVPLGTSTAFTGVSSTGASAPDGYIQNIAAWCTTCHTRYLAPTQSYKTPSGDPTFMYRHRGDANYKQGAANCITCHVSHGSNAVMNNANSGAANTVTDPSGALLPNLKNAGVDAGVDNSRLLRVNNRGVCEMCHNV